MKSSSLNRDDAPALTGAELKRPDGKWRIGGKEVSPEEGRAALSAKLRGKVRINIHLDKDLIAYYKGEAGARGYQTLINSALRRDMEGADLKEDLVQEVSKQMQDIKGQLAELQAHLRAPAAERPLPAFATLQWGLQDDNSLRQPAKTIANSAPQFYGLVGRA